MSTTPGHRPLQYVEDEKNEVLDAVRHHLPTEHLSRPSADQVIQRLQQCCITHFACHGSTDLSDPSNSGLILQKFEGSELAKDELTVHRISELRLPNAQIAYLSACSTAKNSVPRLTDEVIHVVSGFLVAGFPHVVGCLWPSADRVCVEVAKGFIHRSFGKEALIGAIEMSLWLCEKQS
jgi:CHAT domain-containing protein